MSSKARGGEVLKVESATVIWSLSELMNQPLKVEVTSRRVRARPHRGRW